MELLGVLFKERYTINSTMAATYSVLLKPILGGWAVCLSDGRELARFWGPGARLRALRYLGSR